jgi:hypothetical protein
MVVRLSADESPDSSIARSKNERESCKRQLLTLKKMPCGFQTKGGEIADIEPGVHFRAHLKPAMKHEETPRESRSSVMKKRWNLTRSWMVPSASGEIAVSVAVETA